ncbi:MAG: hypothetical protein AAF364_06720 [Pseudomonadota bacterium]
MQEKKYLLIARGSSHIRYFRKFAEATSLNVSVIKINSKPFLPLYFSYLKLTKGVDLESLNKPHLLKKERKHPRLAGSFFWSYYSMLSRFLLKLDIAKSAALIDKENADVVGVWNGQKQPSSSIAAAAILLGKEVVYFENGLLPNSTTCDWKGVNCQNSLPSNTAFYRQFDNDKKELPTELVPRAPTTVKAKGVELNALPKKYVFVPFQVETDSQIISNSPWIRCMGQLYEHLESIIEKVNDPNLFFVIKEHPSESTRHDHLHDKHKRILFANQCNTQMLIEKAQAVITVNSTVGIESLLLSKPVIALGSACYGVKGVCLQANSELELLDLINNLARYHSENTVTRGFLNFLHQHYVIPTAWSNIDEEHVTALTLRLLKKDTFTQLLKEKI